MTHISLSFISLFLYSAICEDYVTEKIFTLMRFNIIPVVFGGAKYDQLFPKNSYIDALSFESPEHLAKFLLKVGSDESLYNKYFEWKNEYEVLGPHSSSLCNLCAKIANPSEPNKYHSSDYLYEWWVKSGKCRQIKFKP